MKNRNMFYQNIEQGYNNPGMFIPPQGYNLNAQYQSYGMPNTIDNDYEDRISRLERQIKVLDNRLQKLENTPVDNDNIYMI